MEETELNSKNDKETNKHVEIKHINLAVSNKRLILSVLIALIFSGAGLIIYFSTPWLQLLLKSELRKLISLFINGYKIIHILFHGDTMGEISNNTLYTNLFESAQEAHERIANVNWLYWALLFFPFYVVYAVIQESFLMLRRNVRYLKEDCNLKNNFINWQGSMHEAMHQRIAELRVEVKALNSMLDAYRKNAKENDLQHKFVKNKLLEEEEQRQKIDGEPELLTMETTRPSIAKKNKSDSIIEERREPSETLQNSRLKARPKTEESRINNRSLVQPKKYSTPTWMEAKKRLQERSKEIFKSRVDSVRRAKEVESIQCHTSPTLPAIAPAEKKTSIARSKFTSRKSIDEYKTQIPRETKVTLKKPEEEDKILAHKNVISELKARNKKQETSVSAVDLLQPQENLNRISPKKRSLSEAAAIKDLTKVGIRPKRNSEPPEAILPIHFGNGEDIASKLGLEGIGKVKSYTEIFKKKVHVPKSGKEPEITIEGRRRWCF